MQETAFWEFSKGYVYAIWQSFEDQKRNIRETEDLESTEESEIQKTFYVQKILAAKEKS